MAHYDCWDCGEDLSFGGYDCDCAQKRKSLDMDNVTMPEPEYAKYRKAPDYRINNEKWDVMSASLARKLLIETEELNKSSWVNNIHHGHIDQVEWLITTDQAEAYKDACVLETLAWQPIETAPKDGSTILVWFSQHGAMSVRWGGPNYDHTSEYAIWLVDDHKYGPYPVRGYSGGDDTHWMPLPLPPPQFDIGQGVDK